MRLIIDETGRKAAPFPLAIVAAGVERVLILQRRLPFTDGADVSREPLVRDLWEPGSPGPMRIQSQTAEEQELWVGELSEVGRPAGPYPLEMLLEDFDIVLHDLVRSR